MIEFSGVDFDVLAANPAFCEDFPAYPDFTEYVAKCSRDRFLQAQNAWKPWLGDGLGHECLLQQLPELGARGGRDRHHHLLGHEIWRAKLRPRLFCPSALPSQGSCHLSLYKLDTSSPLHSHTIAIEARHCGL